MIAIAADRVPDMAALQSKLPDPQLTAATAWGAHTPGAEIPNPATFVVGRDGVVQWRRLGDERSDWPAYAVVAAALH